MISTKCIAVLFLAAIAHAQEAVQAEDNARQALPQSTLPPVPTPPGQHWTEQMREAVNGANQRISQNMVVVLGALSESMRDAGLNNTRAFASLTRAIVTGVVDLTGVVAYIPRLLAFDLPNQFTEVLRLVRRNEVRVPSSVNEAIDNILVLTRQAEESGISNRVFGPVTRLMPNLFNGAHDFIQTIFTTMFNVFGASVPDFNRSPIPVPARSEAEGNITETTTVPAPSGRYLY